jgi:hypothetical protein
VTAIAAVLLGMTADQMADCLAPADPALCGWLSGTCPRPPYAGGWLCLQHLAYMAELAERR